jgi:hypothetical protein
VAVTNFAMTEPGFWHFASLTGRWRCQKGQSSTGGTPAVPKRVILTWRDAASAEKMTRSWRDAAKVLYFAASACRTKVSSDDADLPFAVRLVLNVSVLPSFERESSCLITTSEAAFPERDIC